LQYLQQDAKAPSNLEQSRKQLIELGTWIEQMEKTIKTRDKTTKDKVNATV